MILKRIFTVLFVLVLVFDGNILTAQDPQFSQYYAAPMYLNPGLTGINQVGRAGVNYRNQWPSLSANFETYSFFVDYNFEDYNSSGGLIVNRDREGIAGLRSTTIGLIYAYQLEINYNWTFRPAIQFGYSIRDLNFDKLTFGDQFDNTGQVRPVTGENFNTGLNAQFFDFSAGGILYNEAIWLGLAMHHINEPNQSIAGGDSPLKHRVSVHGGYKILFEELNPFYQSKGGREASITPTFSYRYQDQFDQLDMGVYLTLEPILFGVWYRGIPFKKLEGVANNEAIVFMVGLNMGRTSMGYSFDYTISDLGIDSGGAHEISLLYAFSFNNPRKPPKEVRELRCPIPFIF